jgi:hypothetical protein
MEQTTTYCQDSGMLVIKKGSLLTSLLIYIDAELSRCYACSTRTFFALADFVIYLLAFVEIGVAVGLNL